MNNEWEIQKRSSNCLGCQAAFVDRDVIHCFLQFEGAQPVRRDYCQRCFESVKEKNTPAGEFSYWQSQFKVVPPPIKVEPVKKDLVELLLKKYLGSQEIEKINLCYILAVMLERKKILAQKDSLVDATGRRCLVYEHNKSAETFVIVDPQLKLSEIPVVQQQVRVLLDAELQKKVEPAIAGEPQPAQP